MAGVYEAAVSGNRISLLTALRDTISREIDTGVPARDLAALSRRLIDIAAELDGERARTDGDEIGDAADMEDAAWES